MARSPYSQSIRNLIASGIQDAPGHQNNGAMGSIPPNFRPAKAIRANRRQFLRGGLLLGGGLLLDALGSKRAKALQNERIAVVGGGLAGLLTTYRLAQHGVYADLFEANTRLGGRMYTDWDLFRGNQYVERGGEWVGAKHYTMHALLDEFGIGLTPYWQFERGTTSINYVNGHQYTSSAFNEDVAQLSRIAKRQVLSVRGRYQYDNHTSGAKTIDEMSAADWITNYVPGGLDSDLGKMMVAGIISEYGEEPERVSGLIPMWYAYGSTARGLAITDEEALGEFYTIKGGNQQLPNAIKDGIDSSQFYFGHHLAAAETTSDGRVRLIFEGDFGQKSLTYDQVVLATPLNPMKDMDFSNLDLPDLRRTLIQELALGKNTKLHCQCDTRYWYEQGSSGIVFGDVPFGQSYEPTIHQAGNMGIISAYLGGNAAVESGEGTPENRAERFLNQLEDFIPGISREWNGLVAHNSWHHSPFTKGAYCNFAPGQITQFLGYADKSAGAVHFAGEYTSTNYWGFMEGAAESGERAARAILGL